MATKAGMADDKKADETETDVQRDEAVAGSRPPVGEFVGRAAGADEGYEGETGAEARQEQQSGRGTDRP